MAPQKDREEFITVIALELAGQAVVKDQHFPQPHGVLELARFLMRASGTLQRLNEEDCNRGLQPREEKRLLDVRVKVAEVCKAAGIEVKFNSDPRGAAIKLRLPSGRSNSWEEGLYCVP